MKREHFRMEGDAYRNCTICLWCKYPNSTIDLKYRVCMIEDQTNVITDLWICNSFEYKFYPPRSRGPRQIRKL